MPSFKSVYFVANMSSNTRMHRALRIVLDVGIFLSVSILAGLMSFNKLRIKPTVRGFFCDDQSLMYPYRPDTVSIGLVCILCVVTPAILMAVIEGVHHYQSRQKGQGLNRSKYATTCYKTIGVFLFGMGLTQILGEIGKLVVGRLRPHFFDVCKPDYSKIDCVSKNVSVYVNVGDQFCTGTDLSLVTDASISICCFHYKTSYDDSSVLAGHVIHLVSSMTTTVAILILLSLHLQDGKSYQHGVFTRRFPVSCYAQMTIIYLQFRFIWTRLELFRLLLQAVFMGVALYVGFSRIMDYKHHWSDVLGGALLGTIVAVLKVRFVSVLPLHRNGSDMQYDICSAYASRIHDEKDTLESQDMKELV